MRVVIYEHPNVDLDGRRWGVEVRNGWFHQFIQKGDNLLALIENERGKMELLQYNGFSFVEPPRIDND